MFRVIEKLITGMEGSGDKEIISLSDIRHFRFCRFPPCLYPFHPLIPVNSLCSSSCNLSSGEKYVLKRDPGSLPEKLTRYQSELNEEQFRVVTAQPRATLVVAGAGTGKTRTITYRVAYLIEQGVSPQRILLATFTNRASREMLKRVEALTGGQNVHRVWGGTFHRIANSSSGVTRPVSVSNRTTRSRQRGFPRFYRRLHCRIGHRHQIQTLSQGEVIQNSSATPTHRPAHRERDRR